MKKALLISLLFLMSGCMVHLRSDTQQDDKNVRVEKDFYFGPKVGQN